jgi:hypothetical protein
MTRLVVTADIHGSYSAWLTLKSLLRDNDAMAVAGDLFDTKYGNPLHADFQPESIRKDLAEPGHPFYYVYGNCDIPAFFPGFDTSKTFHMFGKKIFLHHGHHSCKPDDDVNIIIQGHTHLCSLAKKNNRIFMNPGTIARPRNNIHTYGIIDRDSARLIEIKTGNILTGLKL